MESRGKVEDDHGKGDTEETLARLPRSMVIEVCCMQGLKEDGKKEGLIKHMIDQGATRLSCDSPTRRLSFGGNAETGLPL